MIVVRVVMDVALRVALGVVLFGGLVALVPSAVSAPAQGESGPASLRNVGNALDDLRQGGYVVVMAHGPTVADEEDLDTAPEDCGGQQSLADTGRLMASGVGRFLSRERVAVGMVLSSRYCRGFETAERIAQHTHASKVRRLDELNEAANATPAERARRSAALRRVAGTPPAAGTNTIVVTHRANIGDAFGPEVASVHDGELFVLRPFRTADGANSYRLIHRLTVRDLSAYAKVRRP
jgi:broad specificity phosphatase PhoE